MSQDGTVVTPPPNSHRKRLAPASASFQALRQGGRAAALSLRRLFRFLRAATSADIGRILPLLARDAPIMLYVQMVRKFTGVSTSISELATLLFDPHLVQTLQSALLKATKQASRPGYCTTDHLFTFQQLRQRTTEWHQPLWVAAINWENKSSTQQQRMEGLEGARRRQTIRTTHTTTHKALRPATCIGAHRLTLPSRARNQAGRPAQLQYIMKPPTGNRRDITTESGLPITTPTRNSQICRRYSLQ